MKKLLLTSVGLLLIAATAFGATFSTNIVTVGTYLMLTNRAVITQIQLTSDKAATLDFYDQNSLADPYFGTNYVTAAFTNTTTYTTNYVTSFVGYNGYTNWYTNAGVWTLSVSNAPATNVLAKSASLVVGANQAAVYTTDLLFNRGVVIKASTNASVVLTYSTP